MTAPVSTGEAGPESQATSTSNPASANTGTSPYPVGLAVEFTDHAAAGMVALDKGWFEEAGIAVTSFENYVTGTDLAAALARGGIQAAYLCLVPALNVVANAQVPLKVVAGTHKYGYALVANPSRVSQREDLADPAVKLGCTQPGAAADVLPMRLCDMSGIPRSEVAQRVQRMNPPAQVMALKAGSIDACFVPEHWASLAENLGFSVLASCQDIWPDFPGSVLAVKEDLIRDHPEVVKGLVAVTKKATDWINQNPQDAAAVVAASLSVTGNTVLPEKAATAAARLVATPEVIALSMSRLEYTTLLDAVQVQAVIDYVVGLGYLKKTINADQVLDLDFLAP